MSTIEQEFQSFFRFFASFSIGQVTSSIRVNDLTRAVPAGRVRSGFRAP